MMKNIQWDIKTKILTALILFLAVFTAIFFESTSRDWISSKMLVTQLAASVAFSAYILTTADEKTFSLKSVQGFATLLMIAFVFVVGLWRRYYNHDMLRMLFYASTLLICSQTTVLTPVAALISVYLALKLDGVAVICLPAVVGASLIYLSSSVKDSALWKKILFAVSELTIIAAMVCSFYKRRFFLSVHSLVTEVWDSAGLIIAVVFLIALAVVSIIKKRPLGEVFGCIVAAGFAVVPMFMYNAIAIPASSAMLMLLPVVCGSGTLAEEMCENAFCKIKSKLKK